MPSAWGRGGRWRSPSRSWPPGGRRAGRRTRRAGRRPSTRRRRGRRARGAGGGGGRTRALGRVGRGSAARARGGFPREFVHVLLGHPVDFSRLLPQPVHDRAGLLAELLDLVVAEEANALLVGEAAGQESGADVLVV